MRMCNFVSRQPTFGLFMSVEVQELGIRRQGGRKEIISDLELGDLYLEQKGKMEAWKKQPPGSGKCQDYNKHKDFAIVAQLGEEWRFRKEKAAEKRRTVRGDRSEPSLPPKQHSWIGAIS